MYRLKMREYVRQAGKLGNSLIRWDDRGTTWMLPDGRLVSERLDDEGTWSWWEMT